MSHKVAKREGKWKRVKEERPELTAESAQEFDHISQASVILLADAAQERGCNCTPYLDWFTYNRWKAQGMQVQRGEHGVKLPVPVNEEEESENGERRTFHKVYQTSVFCRCQVKPIEEGSGATVPLESALPLAESAG